MSFLSKPEKQTFKLFCETLLPSLQADKGDDDFLMQISAYDINLATLLEDKLDNALDNKVKKQLRKFFRLLEQKIFNGLAFGKWLGFSKMNLDVRTQILYSLATHKISLFRQSFIGIKQLAMIIYYGKLMEDNNNYFANTYKYQKPSDLSQDCHAAKLITTIKIPANKELSCDVLVIGSGAGGGVVAGELAAAGHDVLVVEKGEFFQDEEYSSNELECYERMYEKQGTLTTADKAISIMTGSVLGGGTTINWTGSLVTPDEVLNDWEHHFGFEGVSGKEYKKSLDVVSKRLNVNSENDSMRSMNTRVFERGLDALSYDKKVIPRNVKNCHDCSFCNFGCIKGAKQGTVKTYLQDAYDKGARILVNTEVERVLRKRGKVSGAELTASNSNGQRTTLQVNCKAVIVCASAINTPAILLRSGLTNPNIGKHLRLHPTTVTTALFLEPIRVWQGAPMTRMCEQFANLDGRGYGVRLMNAHVHPAILAMGTAWKSGKAHKQAMQQMEHFANIIIITRDYYGGQIKINQSGEPIIKYKLNPYDAKHLLKGMQEALRIHAAAGAIEVYAPHNSRPTFCNDKKQPIDSFIKQISRLGIKPHALPLFSAHQMSSARIAGNSKLGVSDPTGETYEVKGLYIADGSVLPTCSGVNPMLTISAIAHFLAQRIKTKI